MYAETPGTIRLTGNLGTSEMADLTRYCDRLRGAGCFAITMNVDAVIDCQRAGLDGLRSLVSGSSGLTVTVTGAHWGQFMIMLGDAPMSEVQGLCDDVRALINDKTAV